MSVFDRARRDLKRFMAGRETVEITLVAPTAESVIVTGLHSKHHFSIDNDGRPVNSRNAYISFVESAVVGYPIRDKSGTVNLKGHSVQVADSTGTICSYKIREWYPDETVGLIVCILG